MLVLYQTHGLGNVPETDQSLANPFMASSAAVCSQSIYHL
jgi:hypothetical protein